MTSRARASVLVAFALGLAPATLHAAQVVVADAAVTHTDATGAVQSVGTGALPADLTAPDAFATGTLHHRVIVTNLPAVANATTIRACFVQGANRACSDNTISFDTATTAEATQAMNSLQDYATIDWSMPIDDIEVVALDAAGVPVDASETTWIGSPDFSLYYPLELTYQAVVVADGDAFEGYPGEMLTPSPTLQPGSGTYEGSVDVTIEAADPTHAIHYTVNGDDPDATSTLYNGSPITLSQTTTLKAIAIDDADESSAVVEATYTIVDMLPNGLRGRYYNGREFGELVMTRTDPSIDFSWDGTTPDPNIDNPFSVIWTGQVIPRYTDDFTFKTVNDDGVRLWVNNRLVIDDWNDHGPQERTGNIDLQEGVPATIWFEYYNGGGPGSVSLSWLSDQQGEEIISGTSLVPDLPAGAEAFVSLLSNLGEEVRESETDELAFRVRRRGDIESSLSVTLTVGGTATAGQDFTPIPDSIEFAPGELSKRVAFTLTDDDTTEGDETIEVTLEEGSGYSLSEPTSFTLTIVDDDVDEFTISGQVLYTGSEAGDIIVEAFREDDASFQKRSTVITEPGDYEITGVEPGEHTVVAFIDGNANGRLDDGEVWGQHVVHGVPTLVTIPPAATDILIDLDADPTSGEGDEDGDDGDGGCCATTRPHPTRAHPVIVLLALAAAWSVRRDPTRRSRNSRCGRRIDAEAEGRAQPVGGGGSSQPGSPPTRWILATRAAAHPVDPHAKRRRSSG